MWNGESNTPATIHERFHFRDVFLFGVTVVLHINIIFYSIFLSFWYYNITVDCNTFCFVSLMYKKCRRTGVLNLQLIYLVHRVFLTH
jgi:hypothetical protein